VAPEELAGGDEAQRQLELHDRLVPRLRNEVLRCQVAYEDVAARLARDSQVACWEGRQVARQKFADWLSRYGVEALKRLVGSELLAGDVGALVAFGRTLAVAFTPPPPPAAPAVANVFDQSLPPPLPLDSGFCPPATVLKPAPTAAAVVPPAPPFGLEGVAFAPPPAAPAAAPANGQPAGGVGAEQGGEQPVVKAEPEPVVQVTDTLKEKAAEQPEVQVDEHGNFVAYRPGGKKP
jgi:hypothetical protein